jgi:hypothetical protein
MIQHWLRPLKSNLSSSFLDENWIASTTDFCIVISANPYVWLLPKPGNYRIFWGGAKCDVVTVSFLSLCVSTEHVKFRVNQRSGRSTVKRLCQLVTTEEELSVRQINCWKIMNCRLTSLHCAWRIAVWQVVKWTLWEKWGTNLVAIPVSLYNRVRNLGQQNNPVDSVQNFWTHGP